MGGDGARRLGAAVVAFAAGLALAGYAVGASEPPPTTTTTTKPPPFTTTGQTTTTPPPPALDARDDAVDAVEDTPLTIDVATLLANDVGTGVRILGVGNNRSDNGATVTLAGSTITYTQQRPNFTGTDRFLYTASDAAGARDNAWVTVTVANVNDPPQVYPASGGPFRLWEGTPYRGGFGFFVYDPDGDALTYSWSGGNGIDLQPSGAVAAAVRDDGPFSTSVALTVTDPSGETATASEPVDVVNIEPQVTATAYSGPWGVPLALQGSVVDWSQADTAAGFQTAWHVQRPGETQVDIPGTATSYTYAQTGPYQVWLSAIDKDGAEGDGWANVWIDARSADVRLFAPGAYPFGFTTLLARVTDQVDPKTARYAGQRFVFVADDVRHETTLTRDGFAYVSLGAALLPGTHTVGSLVDGSYGDNLYAGGTRNDVTVENTAGRVSGRGTTGSGPVDVAVRSDGQTIQGTFQLGSLTASDFTAYGEVGSVAWLAGHATDGRSFVARVVDDSGPSDQVSVWIDGADDAVGGPLSSGHLTVH
jgi:hypothetical protein